jgi:hypothetical protein
MATAKKITKKQATKKTKATTKAKTTIKKVVVKKVAPKKKPLVKIAKKTVTKKPAKTKELSREECLKLLYPYTRNTAEKLQKVLQFTEVEIYDLVRKKLVEAFSIHEHEFDSLIEWLDSGEGDKFFDENYLSSGIIANDILGRSKDQFQTDSWNEDHATLVKTARYVFDEGYSLHPDDWYEPSPFKLMQQKNRSA